jgi:hypothetical protein
LADAHPGVMQVGDLDPLLLRQEPHADLTHLKAFQWWNHPDDLPVPVGLVATGPVVPSGARDTDLARGRKDRPSSFAQLHEPRTLGRQRTPPRPLLHTTR